MDINNIRDNTLPQQVLENMREIERLKKYQLKPRGEYSLTEVYSEGDIVEYEGSAYIYINETDTAGVLPANEEYYTIFVKRGKKGEKGDRGDEPYRYNHDILLYGTINNNFTIIILHLQHPKKTKLTLNELLKYFEDNNLIDGDGMPCYSRILTGSSSSEPRIYYLVGKTNNAATFTITGAGNQYQFPYVSVQVNPMLLTLYDCVTPT